MFSETLNASINSQYRENESSTHSNLPVIQNPVTDILLLPEGLERIMLYDINGRLLNIPKSSNNFIDVSSLTPGLYILTYVWKRDERINKIIIL